MSRKICRLISLSVVMTVSGLLSPPVPAQELTLNQGDHICLIGNTLAERMQHNGWLETLIQAKFPQHELVFRNLGFSGDELTVRQRARGFGSPDEHLTFSKADVIFAFFGYNESFAGPEGLERFKADLEAFVTSTLSKKYNGRSAPRLVLFSPIAHENLGDPNLPDGTENNGRLELYTRAMREVAEANQVPFVDLYAPTIALYDETDTPLTINGIHLNKLGNRRLAMHAVTELFPESAAVDWRSLEPLRKAVVDKNFHWFNRHRTVDGNDVYGGRADLAFVDGQTNRVVAQREMEVLDVMTDNRDRAVWAVAQGRSPQVDDGNAPPFIPVKTNKPGPLADGKHEFLGGEEAIGRMTVADGMQVNLFASEEMFPELASPVQMAFDTKGRLWVAAWPSYPHWIPREEMNDKLLILEDTNRDGTADACKVFAGGLHNPTGFEFWGGGVLVAQAPDLLFLKDTDGDDLADVKQRILHGLDSADTHHTANSFTLGPGGELFFQEGTFHHTQVETPYGPPVRSVNAAVFRFEPRTAKFEVYVPYGFANPHGHVFDYWGQDFVTDGTGSQNYFAAAFSGHLDHPRKHPGMRTFFPQRTRPTGGTEILSSAHFPERYRDTFLLANVIGFQGILQYEFQEEDSGFEGTEIEYIVRSTDPNFRPVDIETGPDGALYFLDWQNPIIGHMQHNVRDPSRDRVHGRVYRVTHTERPLLAPPAIAGQPLEQLLHLLKQRDNRVRYRAKIELSGRETGEVIDALKIWIGALDASDPDYEHHLLEGLWVHQHHNVVDESLLRRMLRSPNYNARAAATRVLCYWRDAIADSLTLLAVQAEDEHPRVRLEGVRAASFFRNSEAAEVALLATKQPTDYYLDYALDETMKQLEPFWKQDLAAGEPLAADNPAGLDYLLGKVSNADLPKMHRTPAVYQALLTRPEILHDYRHEAAMALAVLNGTDVPTELLAAIERLDASDAPQAQGTLSDLAHLLTSHPGTDFSSHRQMLEAFTTSARRPITRWMANVALIQADKSVDRVWQRAVRSPQSLRELLDAVPLIPDQELRAALHPRIKPLLNDELPESLAGQHATDSKTSGRFVRLEATGRRPFLALAEVEVFSDDRNVALRGAASESPGQADQAAQAVDGDQTNLFRIGRLGRGQSSDPASDGVWWEVDLGEELPIDRVVYHRGEATRRRNVPRGDNFTLKILDSERHEVLARSGGPLNSGNPGQVTFELEGPIRALRRSAINAVTYTGVDEEETFKSLATLVRENKSRSASVRALSRIPRRSWAADEVAPLVGDIIAHIRELPSAQRTSVAALDELALGNRLAAVLPRDQADRARRLLREVGVNVIRLRPVPHKMLYDRTQIFVEAGKPVEVVFENVDIMPHNLVFASPGSLAVVGIAGEEMVSQPDAFEKQFVPDRPEVLFASKLLQPGGIERIRFTAPTTLGEYPYVCTFPGHWRRMYGTMHVVSSLDAVPLETLAPSSDPEIQTRPFVRAWTFDDLVGKLDETGGARSFERGRELFTAVSCVQCHRVNGAQGGQVGPDLVNVKKKLEAREMLRADVLRELIEPSSKIDQAYATTVIVDAAGRVHTGIVAERNQTQLRLVANPLDGREPITISREDVEEEIPSKVSMMPAGLLNTLTEDEIFDLLGYVESAGDPDHTVFAR